MDGGDLATVYRATDPEQDGRTRESLYCTSLSDVDAVAERLLAHIDVARSLQHPAHACEAYFWLADALLGDGYIEGKDLERVADGTRCQVPSRRIGLEVAELLQQSEIKWHSSWNAKPHAIRVVPRLNADLGMGISRNGVDVDDVLYKKTARSRYSPPELLGGTDLGHGCVFARRCDDLLVSGR